MESPTNFADGDFDLKLWRKAERARLIEERLSVRASERKLWSERIAEALIETIGDPTDRIVSGYWPFRGEPELLSLLRRLGELGARTALPVVVAKGEPLVFRAWKSGDRMEHGVWRIPIPAEDDQVIPHILIAPVVGFDPEGYRLGYGGGFFDRTLASFDTNPLVLGVGYSLAAIPTIHPQAHDIPMSRIITEKGVAAASNVATLQ